MTTDSSNRRFGDFRQPVQASSVTATGDLNAAFDPAIDRLISFCQTVLVAELGSAWDAAKANWTKESLRTSSVVEDTTYSQPTRGLLRESNFAFPLLAVYRKEERHEAIHLRERRAIVEIGIDYILPPLPAEDERRIQPVLNAVVKSLTVAFEDMGHPAYNNGLAAFFYSDEPGAAIFASLETKRARYGKADFGQDGQGAEFLIAQMNIEAVEHDGHTSESGEASFDSVFGSLHVGGSEGNVQDLVELEAPV